jgi:hypothetical protein
MPYRRNTPCAAPAHRELRLLFKRYDQLIRSGASDQEKIRLVLDICSKLNNADARPAAEPAAISICGISR